MIWVRLGAVLMFVGVGLGAFGAHALRGRLTAEMLQVFETGVRYHFYHSLGLFVVGWLAETHPNQWITGAGVAFAVGVFVFSGSLYILAISGVKWWGSDHSSWRSCVLGGLAVARRRVVSCLILISLILGISSTLRIPCAPGAGASPRSSRSCESAIRPRFIIVSWSEDCARVHRPNLSPQ